MMRRKPRAGVAKGTPSVTFGLTNEGVPVPADVKLGEAVETVKSMNNPTTSDEANRRA
jgi:hypothetical protein